ncbi:MAG: dihydrodipicolinate synthase family protein [Planctomycetaceae bacterium]
MKTQRLTGLIAATFTPMRADGRLNLPQVAPIVERLVADGVRGLYVCGSTGEGPCLSVAERKAVLDAYLQAAGGRVAVVAQVGHDSLVEAADLARHAAAAGVDAISAVPPYYFKPESIADLVACIEQVAAAAPESPFYYYHIPRLTGLNANVVELARAAGERIPTFAGVKYSSMTLDEMQALTALDDGRYNVLFGVDECLLAGLISGAHGAVGSTYNFAAPLFGRVIDALERGDVASASAAQSDAARLIRRILQHGSLPALKAVMRLIGLDCGPSRLPLRSLTDAEIAALRRDVAATGLLPLLS